MPDRCSPASRDSQPQPSLSPLPSCAVGIFPYVLKLLQTTATDLRQTLVLIWAKIMAWDTNSQVGGWRGWGGSRGFAGRGAARVCVEPA